MYGVQGTTGLPVLLELVVQEVERKKDKFTAKGRNQVMEGLVTHTKKLGLTMCSNIDATTDYHTR